MKVPNDGVSNVNTYIDKTERRGSQYAEPSSNDHTVKAQGGI